MVKLEKFPCFQSGTADRSRKAGVSEANTYNVIESALALGCSFVINLFVVTVFAVGLFGKTNADVVSNFIKIDTWKNSSSYFFSVKFAKLVTTHTQKNSQTTRT